ncbi:MAG: ArsR family transcriptional regulator [Candidatus Nitrosotenuis sp.]|nr:MAG: ArsR family transcriptional regulator [Candidatus Nitrosotenuis sp.]
MVELRQEIEALEKLNKFLEGKILRLTQVEDSPEHWIKIESQDTIFTIVSAYSDPVTKKILESINEKPLTISEIIERTNLPQTTTYRKINEMIHSKLIRSVGLFLNKDHKRVHSFSAVIKHMRMYFEENEVLMFVIAEDNAFP